MTTMKMQLTFPHEYQVEELAELSLGKARHLYFPGGSEEGGHDGVMVAVTPNTGLSWTGTFAFGDRVPGAITAICSCPDPAALCVVARGQGYMVNAQDPSAWKLVETYPILDLRAIIDKGLLVFSDFTRISAYGPKGQTWMTSDLSWDGVRIDSVSPDEIRGLAWDSPDQREVEFCVDVNSGRHIGGASRKQH
jgi:hypothetical protein